MEELNQIVQNMIDAGESESNIKLVIESYNPQEDLAKTNDSASADPAVESNQNSMDSTSAEPLSAWQSIKNSFSNLGEQVGDVYEYWFTDEGANSSLDIATNGIFSAIAGQDSADEWAKKYGDNTFLGEGIGSEATLEAIKKYEIEKGESKDTKGIIESFKEGDAGGILAGTVNALTSMVGSVAYGAGTLGTGFFADYVAENYVEFNKLKAQNLNISFDELVKSGKADNAIPVAMGAVSTGLEMLGLGIVAKGAKGALKGGSGNAGIIGSASKYLAEKLIYNTGAKTAMNVLATGSTEFATEILQHASDQINLELGRVAGTDKESEIAKTFIDAITSQEGLEAGIQGFIGGSGMTAGTYSAKAMSTIRNVVDADAVNKALNEFSVLKSAYKKATDKTVQRGLQNQLDAKESEIAELEVKGQEIYESLDDKQISKIENLRDLADAAAYQVTELNKKLRRGEISEEAYELSKGGFDIQYKDARQSLIDMELEKNIDLAKEEAGARGLDFETFETSKEVADFVEKSNMAESEKQKYLNPKDPKTVISAFSVGNKIVIDKEAAKKTGSINVGMHEFLHPVLNKLVGDVKNQRKMVKQFRSSMTSSQRRFVDKAVKKRYAAKDYYTEYITVFSDALRKKQINYDKTTFEKIGNAIVGLFKPVGYTNISFESGKDVYNFIKEYDQSAEQGKFTVKAQEALKGVDLSEASLSTGKMQESQTIAEAEANLDAAYDADPNDPAFEDNLEAAEDALDAAIEAAKNPVKEVVADKAKPKPKVKVERKKEPTRTTELNPRDPLSKKIMDTYNDGVKGVERSDYSGKSRLPASLENKLIPMFEGYINTIVKQKFKQFETEALEFQDALSILRTEVGSAVRTFNPAKNKDLAGYVKKIVQTRQSLMFKDANAEFTSDLDDAKTVVAESDGPSIDRSGNVERGQATFDELGIVDDALIADIEKDLSKEIRVRTQKGSLSEMISVKKGRETYLVTWLDNYVNKQLFKKLSKKLGAIGERNGETVIPGAYIDFLNDPKTFDIITKALPIKSIKKSYSKLFPIEKVGRELTAEGNPVFKISKIDKKTFLTYFVKGKKSTILERQKQLFREILEPIAKQVVVDYATPENLSELKSIKELAPEGSIDVVKGIVIEAQVNNLQSELDRYKGEETSFDIIQFSKDYDFEQYNVDKKDTKVFLNFLIKEGIDSQTAKKFLLSKGVSENHYERIAGEVISEGILAEMQDIEAANKGIKYEKALSKILEKYTIDGLKVELISRKKGDIKISSPKATYNIEVKLNAKAQIGSASAGIFAIKNGTISLKDNIKLTKKLSEANIDAFNEFIKNDETQTYLNNLVAAINKANKKSSKDIQATISRSGHIKLPNKEFWTNIKNEMPKKQGGFVSYKGNQSIVEDFYKGIDLMQIGEQGAYAIGNQSKLSNLYETLVATTKNVFRPVRSDKTVYMRLFPNLDEIQNKKQNSLDTKEGISNLADAVMRASQTNDEINTDFNNIIEGATGIKGFKTFSEAKGKVRGQNKGKFKFFIPPSADDFAGLMSRLLGKKKQGDLDTAWFKENLFDPFAKGIRNFEAYKEQSTAAVKALKKRIKKIPNGLTKVNDTGFTNEVAVRTYLWVKNDHKINGLSATDQKDLIEIVENNKALKEFADELNQTFEGYPEPTKEWLAGSITLDMINMINTSKRAEFLQAWQEKVDVIFSKENMNKLRAAYGDNYIEALEDMLYRMRTGRNRPSGANKLTNKFMNWVNDSVGTIMFFNTRSALLQTLSIANFINWQENNPAKAAMAFANQKQFWSDFAMLFNSDFLKQRRSGLKNDINADEIAAAAETATNKTKAVLNSILKAGFLPTQMADSFAIAMGGASFIRNRINKYVSEGMDAKAAEEQSFLDFQEIAEETQQSSRPDRISQQQASPLGRIILAFANTPMQYMRLTKKAFLDLKNGRGDAKANISKIVYYTVLQNIIFSSLQSALFAAAFEDTDDDELKDKEVRIANSMLDSILRGLGIYGAIASTGKNILLEIKKQSDKPRPDFTQAALRSLDLSPPISSKVRKLMSTGRAFSYKNVRDKMTGYGLDNPAFYALGQTVSAVTNVPLDRAIKKADNIRVAMDNDTKLWQSIALALGYSQWDLGLVETSSSKKTKSKIKKRTLKRRTLKRRTLNRK